MCAQLMFPDAATAADVLTFARRAARFDEAALRLRAADGTLVLTCAPLAPRTLLDSTPTVLGMRAVRIDPELQCDLVISAAALGPAEDPLTSSADPCSLQLPESAVTATWAGISPPRTGWQRESEIAASALAARAQWGIAGVAERVPRAAGPDAVHAVRAAVWGASDDELAGLPLGVAFAAFALGFIVGDEQVAIFRNGGWIRLDLQRGHVLTRSTVRTGLTAVRATG